jgi:hypothetical protein
MDGDFPPQSRYTAKDKRRMGDMRQTVDVVGQAVNKDDAQNFVGKTIYVRLSLAIYRVSSIRHQRFVLIEPSVMDSRNIGIEDVLVQQESQERHMYPLDL